MSTATIQNPNNEAAIWTRVIQPDRGDLTLEVARFFLQLGFDEGDLARMHELTSRNQDGLLTDAEEEELRSYRAVGLRLDLLRSKARRTIQQQRD